MNRHRTTRRMLRPILAAALVPAALALAATPAAAQTADEVIAKNLEARGGKENIQAVDTVRFTGTMQMGPGMDAPFVLEWKRPEKVRIEFTLQGMTGIQAYDGETAWYVMPFLGSTEPQRMPDAERETLEEMADSFEGPLLDYAAKGHEVEYLGTEEVDGTPAHKLEVTLANGNVNTIWLDADAYLEIQTAASRDVRGQTVTAETEIGDYKEVAGLLLPHSMIQKVEGAPEAQVFTIDEVELGVPIDDERFAMPEPSEETAGDAAGEGGGA